METSHITIEPSILYFGTPVVLISTQNEDGTANVAPMSSAWWLGWRCMLGLATESKTSQNLIRTGECVLNLASIGEAEAVNRLARLTGANPVPASKQRLGYSYEADKFGVAGLTPMASQTIGAVRVRECPVQMEAVLAARHEMMTDNPPIKGFVTAFEVRITRVHVDPRLRLEGHDGRIDPGKWKPLIMSFQKFYGLADGEVLPSRLAQIEERAYRMPDVDRAHALAQSNKV